MTITLDAIIDSFTTRKHRLLTEDYARAEINIVRTTSDGFANFHTNYFVFVVNSFFFFKKKKMSGLKNCLGTQQFNTFVSHVKYFILTRHYVTIFRHFTSVRIKTSLTNYLITVCKTAKF